MSYLINTNHSSTENGSTEWASFGLGSYREGGCPGPLPGANWSSGEMWPLGHRGIFLEEKRTELPALDRTAKKENLCSGTTYKATPNKESWILEASGRKEPFRVKSLPGA